MYQIVRRFLDEKLKNTFSCTFIEVSHEFESVKVAFPREKVNHTLAEAVADAGKTQLHMTETEKYTHLTYFLNSGREKEYNGETWKLIQSNRFVKPMYNFEPSMRAFDLSNEVISAIKDNKYDLMIVNFPNTDMVGHTGNYEAALIGAEAVDYCLGKIYEAIKDKLDEYALLVTADHGNAEEMWDYKNEQPHTQHTTNPVPFILISDIKTKLHRRDTLQDIAPTILDLMNVEKPIAMKGESLIVSKA